MTKNTKIAIAIFTAIIGLLLANAFAPYELRDFETINDNEQSFVEIDNMKHPLTISYGLSFDQESKNFLLGFGGYYASVPDEQGSIVIKNSSLENTLQSVQITQLQLIIDGKLYDLPTSNEQVQFDYFTGADGKADDYAYAYNSFVSPVIPQNTFDINLLGIITDKKGQTATFSYQSTGKIKKFVKIMPYWQHWKEIPEIFTYS